MSRDRQLEDKCAIVTGAASGIGRAIADLFVDQGARVVYADLDRASASAAAAQHADRSLAAQVDVADSSSVGALVGYTVTNLGAIDILVNCAGVPQLTCGLGELDEDLWDRVLAVNTKSVFLTCRQVAPHMRRQGGGAIINIGSIVGTRPKSGQQAYCASKAATIALSQSLALELAADGIRVNIVNPGAAETPMLASFQDATVLPPERAKQMYASAIPMGRLIQPSDVAEATLFLASPYARQITGAVYCVDGGRSI